MRVCATAAVRDAADRQRFLDGVHARAGVEAEVLSGEQEAAASFAGAVGGVAVAMPALVLDIGGGSTELIVGYEPARRLDQPAAGLRAAHGALPARGPADGRAGRDARAVIADELDAATAALGIEPERPRSLVGVAGTVTTLGALHLGLEHYDPERIHGTRVPRTVVGALTRALLSMPARDRAALGPVQPGREDVLAGGALILEAVLERFGFDEVVVSETDILDGLAAQALALTA